MCSSLRKGVHSGGLFSFYYIDILHLPICWYDNLDLQSTHNIKMQLIHDIPRETEHKRKPRNQ